MRIWVGIDLGSTTTKAIVLDENEKILGKGITNSRSNYDVACAVAQSEAMVNARFELFRRFLDANGFEGEAGQKLTGLLEQAFRREQMFLQLKDFFAEISREASTERYEAVADALMSLLEKIMAGMEDDIEELFCGESRPHSDFFRDIASSSFMKRAEELAADEGVSFDLTMGLFDKCIIRVENHVLDLSFENNIRPALARALAASESLSEAQKVSMEEGVAHAVELELVEVSSVGTGYGRSRLPFPREQIRSEILCHGLGAHWLFPKTTTVLDIGGQDTKAIQVDSDGIVTSFQMNDRCAAGCGRYLGYIADEMNLGLHELGPMAQKSCRTVKISSTCTVFAGAELRDRLTLGEKREDILAGLHRAMMLRAMSLLARSGGINDEFTFTGGVAKNPAAVEALEDLVRENYGERTLNISPDSIYTGAIGAALFARRGIEAEQSEAA